MIIAPRLRAGLRGNAVKVLDDAAHGFPAVSFTFEVTANA